MHGEFRGKIAMITGASRGIGKCIALGFAREGAKVVISSRNKNGELDKTAEEIRAIGVPVLAVTAHMAKNEDLDNLVTETLSQFGRIDILVNNAGANPRMGTVVDTEEWVWDYVMNVNLKGVFLLSQKVAKVMLEQKKGCIINISSAAGIRAEPFVVPYSISKAGVIALADGLARELGPYGIRVASVLPGIAYTNMSQAYLSDEKSREDRIEGTSLRRIGEPQEVADAVLFLASNRASYITGASLVVDGGTV